MKSLNLIDRTFLLKGTPLFGALDLDLLLTIADKLEWVRYKEGETIFQLDQEASLMYLITEGTVRVYDKDQVEIACLTKGDFFGDESIFSEQNRKYGVTCLTTTSLLTLSRNHLLGIITECPSVAIALLSAYSASITFRAR